MRKNNDSLDWYVKFLDIKNEEIKHLDSQVQSLEFNVIDPTLIKMIFSIVESKNQQSSLSIFDSGDVKKMILKVGETSIVYKISNIEYYIEGLISDKRIPLELIVKAKLEKENKND